jgi:peptide-methionine (S)-S-oxide reductase
MGGHGDYPTYNDNYTQLGYSETVRLMYDPEKLTFNDVMQAYWQFAPDPTYPESDPAYKNRIFTTTPEQLKIAKESLSNATAAANTTIYVDIQEASSFEFWKAEESNQQFDFKGGATCSSGRKLKTTRGFH